MESSQSQSRLDDLIVIKTLGKGATAKVKLVQDENGNQFAAKIMLINNPLHTQRFKQMVEDEVSLIQQIDHPNVVKVFRCKDNGVYSKKDGTVKEVMYILMEFCSGGEVFEFLFQTGAFNEEMTRAYFKQLINAIEAVHNAGVTHRDLKPENILLDKDFNLKITDFGYAIVLSGKDGSGMLKSHKGTEAYMAPEIHAGKDYIGRQVDLFACGIILFILKSQNPPWSKATSTDPWFRIFSQQNPNQFWEAHSRAKRNPSFYSQSFRNLMHCMCSYESSERLSVSEIKQHPYWEDGPTADAQQILAEFSFRQQKVQEAAEKARLAKQSQKFQAGFGRTAYGQGRVFRSIELDTQQSEKEESEKVVEKSGSFSQSDSSPIGNGKNQNRIITNYKNVGRKWTLFTTQQDKEDIFFALEKWISKNAIEKDTKISEDQYKIVTKINQEEIGEVELQVKLFQHQDQIVVDFTRLTGDSYSFSKIYNLILESSEVSDFVDGEPIA